MQWSCSHNSSIPAPSISFHTMTTYVLGNDLSVLNSLHVVELLQLISDLALLSAAHYIVGFLIFQTCTVFMVIPFL